MSCKSCSESPKDGHVVYQYAAKVVCGVVKPIPPGTNIDNPLPPGEYKTKINIHNFSRCDCVTFRWKVAVGYPHLKVGPISEFAEVTLCPDEALEIDCADIMKRLGRDVEGHIEGWVVLYTPSELDVVAVYGTAATPGGSVNAFHTERVHSRCLTACEDFNLDISTGVSQWEVAGPFPGQAPPGSPFTDVVLGSSDPNWTNLPGALWIHPPGGNVQPEGTYTYRLRFRLCDGFMNPQLGGSMLADYFANAFLNGNSVSPTQTGGPNYPTPINITATGNFKAGMNELIVVVTNKERGTTGLALHGDIEVKAGLCPGVPMPLLCCPNIQYNAHMQRFIWESFDWWQGWRSDGQTAGTTGENRRMERIKIEVIGCRHPGTTITYQVRTAPLVGGAVWGPIVSEGQDAGNGNDRIEMLIINLVNAPLNCHLCYRVHMRHNGWGPWVTEGVAAGSSGSNRRIEAVEIKFC